PVYVCRAELRGGNANGRILSAKLASGASAVQSAGDVLAPPVPHLLRLRSFSGGVVHVCVGSWPWVEPVLRADRRSLLFARRIRCANGWMAAHAGELHLASVDWSAITASLERENYTRRFGAGVRSGPVAGSVHTRRRPARGEYSVNRGCYRRRFLRLSRDESCPGCSITTKA